MLGIDLNRLFKLKKCSVSRFIVYFSEITLYILMRDGDEEVGYIANMVDSATAGFKYFNCDGIRQVSVKVRGYCNGEFEIKTAWDGPVLGTIPVHFTNDWKRYTADITVPDGRQALYLTYRGAGGASLASFTLA